MKTSKAYSAKVLFAILVAIISQRALPQALEVREVTDGSNTSVGDWRTYWADHSNDRWYNPNPKRLRVTVVDTARESPVARVYVLFLARKKNDANVFIYNYALL